MLTQLFVKPGTTLTSGSTVHCEVCSEIGEVGDLHVTMHCAEGMPAEMSGHWPETVQVDWIEGGLWSG